MCSINHDLKCVYIHLPKCGGSYVTEILEKFYDFKTYYFTSENHINFINETRFTNLNYSNKRGFFYIKKKGMYRYFRYSEKFNILTGMTEDKWKDYFKFTFVRHPFDKFVSAYKFLKLNDKNISFLDIFKNDFLLTPYEYFHIYISLYDNIVNNDDQIEFNYIGRHENLNEDLIKILNKIGITDIKHKYFILNDIVINSSDTNILYVNLQNNILTNKFDITNNISTNFIELFNDKFKLDYDNFNYDKIDINNYKKYIFNNKKISENNKILIEKYGIENYSNIINFQVLLKENTNTNTNINTNINLIYNGIKKNKIINLLSLT